MDNEPWLDEFKEAATNGRTRLMFDIGANYGNWSDWGRCSFAKVVAVDCDKRAYAATKMRFQEAVDAGNVTVLHHLGVVVGPARRLPTADGFGTAIGVDDLPDLSDVPLAVQQRGCRHRYIGVGLEFSHQRFPPPRR